jgi:hypothetical protein
MFKCERKGGGEKKKKKEPLAENSEGPLPYDQYSR